LAQNLISKKKQNEKNNLLFSNFRNNNDEL